MTESSASQADARQDDEAELLYRQISPSFVHDSRVTSQAFRPTPKDDKRLSVSLSSLTTARAAYELFTISRELGSAGVMAVSRGECSGLELPVVPDPLTAPVADPAHALVDFSGMGTSKIEKLSKKLGRKANARGWVYRPED